MSSRSNDQGRAYEYITLVTLHTEISKIRKAVIVKNSSLDAAKDAWDSMGRGMQNLLAVSAASFVPEIFDLEPLILEDDGDCVELLIQKDSKGEDGDVRDILIVRSGIEWEIGLSMKHNHFAVKHSRLSHIIDFGKKWYGVPCSKHYWESVLPIFENLQIQKANGKAWSELANKEENVYIPLLNAFVEELHNAYANHKDLPQKMVEYLLGEYDFYKIISIDNKRLTQINSFNLHGTLNKNGKRRKASSVIPQVLLPTRIVNLDFKPGSTNTVELYMDGGWQFSFRIHNASTLVESSLKFDIQIIGMPTTIVTINCRWK
ncbi:MAG: HaeIII family restriction endonuclease [Prevotella sp.]|nr:HaeIII family restriction endonuclease [Prevotella sp.]